MDFFDETELVIMANADLTFNDPKPLFPNVISVEGISVKEAKPLSKGILLYCSTKWNEYLKKLMFFTQCVGWIRLFFLNFALLVEHLKFPS